MTFSQFPAEPLKSNDHNHQEIHAIEDESVEEMLMRTTVWKASDEEYERLQGILIPAKDSQIPLKSRFRALFTLKNLKTDKAVDIIGKAFDDPSALLKHELAYVLGQMKNPHAIPVLITVLENNNEEPMVRHEAAEALGAIGDPSCLELLDRFADPKSGIPSVVRETCELAVAKIRHEQTSEPLSEKDLEPNHYVSIDPAPPVANAKSMTTQELGDMLMNTSLPLFERYRAMFALRNRGDAESVLALARGLEDESALFRHEIAYVFGQLQHPASVPSLIKVLSKGQEEGMVRHECAEALGSIATEECVPVLEKFAKDTEPVVRESCIVGLDIYEFESTGEMQYAEVLKQ